MIADSLVGGDPRNGTMNVLAGNVTSPNIKVGVTNGYTGTYNQSGGTVTTTNFSADNGAGSVVNFTAGTLNVTNADVDTGSAMVVGDGTNTADLHLTGGTATFAAGLTIAPNSVLSGSGTIVGNLTLSADPFPPSPLGCASPATTIH